VRDVAEDRDRVRDVLRRHADPVARAEEDVVLGRERRDRAAHHLGGVAEQPVSI
jgi:hypothetical protein